MTANNGVEVSGSTRLVTLASTHSMAPETYVETRRTNVHDLSSSTSAFRAGFSKVENSRKPDMMEEVNRNQI